MAQPKTLIITADGERPISAISSDLQRAGFVVGQVLAEIGCITGTADDDQIGKLRSIGGVVDVAEDAPVDVGPPDPPVTW